MVNDDIHVPSEGNELATPYKSTTDTLCLDVSSESVTGYGNIGSDITAAPGLTLNELSSTWPEQLVSETKPVRKSSCEIKIPKRLSEYEVIINYSKLLYPLSCWSLMTNLNEHVEPKNVQEALRNPIWKQVMDLEMQVLLDNNT